jgi:hypothetical protein
LDLIAATGFRSAAIAAFALAVGFQIPLAHAEESQTPYLDQLRKEMSERGEPTTNQPTESYTESLKRKLKNDDAQRGQSDASEGYTDRVKKELDAEKPEVKEKSYTDQEKSRLGPGNNDSAIQAVKEGRSELHAKRTGEIHHAAGLKFGPSLVHDISAASALRSFDSVYGANYAYDFQLFYEYQPWHSEWYGNLGFFGLVGVGYYHGQGAFQFNLTGASGQNFGERSRTKFQFIAVPVVAGLNYRFNLLRVLRPFVMVGPAVIGYQETRNDGGDDRSGDSRGLYFSGGVSLLLDWLSGKSTWDLYAEHGVKHYYLSVDYSRLSTFSGDVSYTVSGVYAGLTFEF